MANPCGRRLIVLSWFLALAGVPACAADPPCRAISANVVALDQAFYNNRIGALQTGGMVFALRRDVVSTDGSMTLKPGAVMLRPDKRPRPMVLRANAGDCLTIHFQNLLASSPAHVQGVIPATGFNPATEKMTTVPQLVPGTEPYLRSQPATRWAGVHVMGMQLRKATPAQTGIQSDASWVGTDDNSLVPPGGTIDYEFFAEAEGAYLLYSTGADTGVVYGYGGQLSQGLFGSVTVQPHDAEWYRSQVTRADLAAASTTPPNGFPIIDYKKKRLDGTPILAMLSDSNEIVYSDLTAIITGPDAGCFPKGNTNCDPPAPGGDPVFHQNPAYPNRQYPYREFAIHYHDDFVVSQAYQPFRAYPIGDPQRSPLFNTYSAGRDFFAINYGIGGIGPEVFSNRLGTGPMEQCATCKFEEFFLTSWSVGDPAMVVDFPANFGCEQFNPLDPSTTCKTGPKATKAYYPDDPSNVYHSYIGDNTIFRILHAGTNISHVHHQHAHQWLHSPDSDDSHYRDSQMISPGSGYTLDYVYRGSGNKNQVVGDSIFHCHFYPHFAQGMWAMWRTHDVLELGTKLDANGRPVTNDWNRALPDGEIPNGTPIPAIVPMPQYAMAPLPADVRLCPSATPQDFVQWSGDVCPTVTGKINGYRTLVKKSDLDPDPTKSKNPGYPFFIPGLAGQRPPHPPLDFANDAGNELNGGLPRHLSMAELGKPCGTTKTTGCAYEKHNAWDFSKDFYDLLTLQIDEKGSPVEQAAMATHSVRNHPTFTPAGTAKTFLLNGQPPVSGAPYANPDVQLDGSSTSSQGKTVIYKAADIQLDVVLNKKGWHYPQQRILTLWGDVLPTLNNQKRPEPLFFRVNSGDTVEYWHSNLVPNYYELDDFQVRTPTDILGQHIHLVKFDVTASDGAGNGFNYEDGTFSPQEVQELIGAVNQNHGLWNTTATSQSTLTAKNIPDFGNGPGNSWIGAQATIQRWFADPLCNNLGTGPTCSDGAQDRTMQTVFTHDHFGPSTHQQTGLYAGLVIEPRGSQWLRVSDGNPLQDPARKDGGPTSWEAIIVPPNNSFYPPYREFLLEFQDRQLAYLNNSPFTPTPYARYTGFQKTPTSVPLPFAPCGSPISAWSAWGWAAPCYAVNKPLVGNQNNFTGTPPRYQVSPKLITNQSQEGSFSLNYRNEPVPYRVNQCSSATDPKADLANAFASVTRCDPALNVQPLAGTAIATGSPFQFSAPFEGAQPTDPYTPLLRAYEGERIQIRNLVGAHMFPHSFTVHGLKWLFEPAVKDSGYRSTQGMGISEHYEYVANVPGTPSPNATADYLYETTSNPAGLTGGNWGILRAYKHDQANLARVPGPGSSEVSGCTAPDRKLSVTAATARDLLRGPLIYNARGDALRPGLNQIVDWNALMYVRTGDLVDPSCAANCQLKPDAPTEPLVLRAAAGECIEITLRNRLAAGALNAGQTLVMIGRVPSPAQETVAINTSHQVGLHAQLVSYDPNTSDGFNVGLNSTNTAAPGSDQVYHWYAGTMTATGKTPIEFGAVSLTPADPMMQHIYGLIGGLVVEPAGSTWVEDANTHAQATVTKADATQFRDLAAIVQDDVTALRFANTYCLDASSTGGPHWSFNGQVQANNWSKTLVEGDMIAVTVSNSFHGFSFLDKAQGQLVFDVSGGVPFADQPAVGATAWGAPGMTPASSEPLLLASLRVRRLDWSTITGNSITIKFECTVHKAAMAGQFVINRPSGAFGPPATSATPSNWTRAVNYRTEPMSYRFANPNWLQNLTPPSPNGITRVLADELVLADPQTPVFAASSMMPVRMRVFHPAGNNEEVWTLHGHVWQEEPYSNGSTEMGSNQFSQWTGSRDTFGANASFDMLLEHAGGNAGVTGDYLYRTFIGTDFNFGMWGFLRVGAMGADIIRVTQFQEVQPQPGQNKKRIIVTGANTVNPKTGVMANEVTIFAGDTTAGPALGTAPVNSVTGAWIQEFNLDTVPTSVTVQSAGGGQATSGPVPGPRPPGPAVTMVRQANPNAMSRLMGATIDDDPEVNRFRDAPRKEGAPPPGNKFLPADCKAGLGCDDSPALTNPRPALPAPPAPPAKK
jgi:hypothetical protein